MMVRLPPFLHWFPSLICLIFLQWTLLFSWHLYRGSIKCFRRIRRWIGWWVLFFPSSSSSCFDSSPLLARRSFGGFIGWRDSGHLLLPCFSSPFHLCCFCSRCRFALSFPSLRLPVLFSLMMFSPAPLLCPPLFSLLPPLPVPLPSLFL